MTSAQCSLTTRNGFAFFWGDWPSNWFESPFISTSVVYHGRDFNPLRKYGCVEQFMMAEKARCFGDVKTENLIMATAHPREQKALGRQVRGYDDAKWAVIRYEVVLKGSVEKYAQNPDLYALLDATGDLTLVEASPKDRIWGIGLSEDDENAAYPARWRGQNLLGKAITEAREILRKRKQAL